MALVLSGSIDISGSMTATTIVVSSPGAAGMVSSSAQITELAPLMAYTASLKGAIEVSGQNINVLGMVTAQQFNVTYVSSSVMYKSGSTEFGDSSDDRHLFTGSLIVSGTLAAGSSETGWGRISFNESTNTLRIQSSKDGTDCTPISFWSQRPGGGFAESVAISGSNLQVRDGRLGIATPTPDTTLHISGSDGIKIQAGGNADTPGLTIINHTNQYGWAKFGGGLQGNGRGYATISNWNGSSVAEHVRVSGDGYLRLAGTGIQFNGDTADANSLDDYEEGTFTATVVGGTTAGTGTYSRQVGVYTKIGNLVTCNVWIQWSAHTGTGDLYFGGFPFTSTGTTNYRASGVFGYFADLTLTAGFIPGLVIIPSSTQASVTQNPVGGGSAGSSVQIDTAANIHFSITYQTT